MAVEKETQLEAWLEENMPEPSGGNPNYVETIEGTLANPWGDRFSDIYNEYNANNVTIVIVYDRYTLFPTKTSTTLDFYGATSMDALSTKAVRVSYRISNGVLRSAKKLEASATPAYTLTDISSDSTCSLRIIHHPLPEN